MTSRYAIPADLVATPRLAGLSAHRDGPVVALRQELSPNGKRYVTHAWAVDAQNEPVQLTHDDRGVKEVCPTASGTVWFTSERPVPGDEDKRTRLWLLPDHGEARAVLDVPEGLSHLQLGGDRLFFAIVAAGAVSLLLGLVLFTGIPAFLAGNLGRVLGLELIASGVALIVLSLKPQLDPAPR